MFSHEGRRVSRRKAIQLLYLSTVRLLDRLPMDSVFVIACNSCAVFWVPRFCFYSPAAKRVPTLTAVL
jgi:hypothetical protein